MVPPSLKNPTVKAAIDARAGYTVAEETPVFLVVLAVPALIALLLRWRLK